MRSQLVYKLVCAAFGLGIFISFPLWHQHRLFPLAPVFPTLPPLPSPLDYILVVGLLALLLVGVVRGPARWLTLGLLTITAVLIGFDQMRLQPWVFIYSLVLAPFALMDFAAGKSAEKTGGQLLNYLLILLCGVYLWSGLHKFTPSFLEIVYPLLLQGLFRFDAGHWLLTEGRWLGYVAAWVEVGVALLLFFPKTRKLGVVMATLVHLLIIAWLSPLGGNDNWVVLPWNLAMIGLVWLAGFGINQRVVVWPRTAKAHWRWLSPALVLLVWVMPVLNRWDKWDSYLSFNLYTERISHMFVALRANTLEESDPRLAAYYGQDDLIEDGKVIDVTLWAFSELKVPVYPAPRVFRAIGRHFCQPPANPDEIMLVTYRRPFVEGNYEIFYCKDCR